MELVGSLLISCYNCVCAYIHRCDVVVESAVVEAVVVATGSIVAAAAAAVPRKDGATNRTDSFSSEPQREEGGG